MGVPQVLKACSLVALVGTSTHIPCKYRGGSQGRLQRHKCNGMEGCWADQVGEAVLILDRPGFVCTALGLPCHGALSRASAPPQRKVPDSFSWLFAEGLL